MKKTIFVLVCISLLLFPAISAIKTGIVIESDSKTYYGCVDVISGDSVYDALKKMDNVRDDISMTIDGELTGMYYLRSINGLGPKTEGDKSYGWNFFVTNSNNDDFTDPPELSPGWGMGIGDYKITKGESIGIKYSYTIYNSDFSVKVPPEKPDFFSSNQLCNNLVVNITKIYVDGEKQSETKTRSGKITDVFPESKVEFKIELENLYHSSTDISIKDISIEGVIEEINDGADIEEDVNEFDLEADRKTTKDLMFTIPLEVEAKDRLVKIDIGAKDDAGIKYDIKLTYDLEIEKESHKLKIIKAELDKDSYTCEDNALLDLSILNIGAKDENINLKIRNEELGIDINEDFELSNNVYEESSRYNNKFNIWIPSNLDKAAYPVTITASYGSEEEISNVDLIISECEGAEEAESVIATRTKKLSNERGVSESKEAELEEPTATEEAGNNNLPLVLAIILVVLVVVIIALFLMFWIRKSSATLK